MKKILLACLLVSNFVSISYAEVLNGAKGDVETGIFGGYGFPDDYTTLTPDNGFLIGARIGYWFTNRISTEGSVQRIFSEISSGASSNLNSIRLNVLYHMLPGHRLRPFVTLGAGYEHISDTLVPGQSDSDTKDIGLNTGLGGHYGLGQGWIARLEGRYNRIDFDSFSTSQKQNNFELMVGISKLWGPKKQKQEIVSEPVEQTVEAQPEPQPEPVEDVQPEAQEKVRLSLQGVQFNTGTSRLTPDSKMILQNVAEVLNEFPDTPIEVEGHTDSVGNLELNQKLSDQRAEAVKTELIEQGVEQSRITSKGYGPTMPIADNETEQGRAKNRRVEIKWMDSSQ